MSRQAEASKDGRVVRGVETRARIFAATKAELAKRGADLTLDHVAARLGLTKQAVLYHFPTKDRLLVELSMLGIAEEADAMCAAVVPTKTAGEAVRGFMRANVEFHLKNLQRFRLTYVRGQVVPGTKDTLTKAERDSGIYAQTTRMYAALEAKLKGDPNFPADLDARKLAVAVHLAAIGFATMAGELQAVDDSMKLPIDQYANELVTALLVGLAPRASRARR